MGVIWECNYRLIYVLDSGIFGSSFGPGRGIKKQKKLLGGNFENVLFNENIAVA
jgi:hypothetical protein